MEEQAMWSEKCPRTVDICLLRCNISDDILRNHLSRFTNVEELDLSGSNFTILPSWIKECHLLQLILNNCEHLREVEGIPPNLIYLEAQNCTSLSVESQSLFLSEKLHTHPRRYSGYNYEWSCVPSGSIPKWFEHRSRKGEAISFWFRNSFPTLCLSALFQSNHHPVIKPIFPVIPSIHYSVLINDEDAFPSRYSTLITENILIYDALDVDHLYVHNLRQDHIPYSKRKWLGRKNKWNHVKMYVYLHPTNAQRILESGIHVIDELCEMEDITFQNPYDYILDSDGGDDQEISNDDDSGGDMDSNYVNNDEASLKMDDLEYVGTDSWLPWIEHACNTFKDQDEELLSLRPCWEDESASHQEFQQPENVTSISVEQVPESFEDNIHE